MLSVPLHISFFVSLLTVGIAFVGHELAHRYLAQYAGYTAEFRIIKFGMMLIIASGTIGIILSIFTKTAIPILFGYPGAVMILPREELVRTIQETQHLSGQRRIIGKWYALIKSIGIMTNIAFAMVFLLIQNFFPSVAPFAYFGYRINVGLAFFNALPIRPIDGEGLFSYSPKLWIALFAALLLLEFLGP
jgi:Zn-dependent protease